MHRLAGINGNAFRWGSHPSGNVFKKNLGVGYLNSGIALECYHHLCTAIFVGCGKRGR
jgi:hypothetical protein